MTFPDSSSAACTLPVLQAPPRQPATVQDALLDLGSCALASAAPLLDDALQGIGEQDALDLAGLLGCLDSARPGSVLDTPAVSAEQPQPTSAQQYHHGCPALAAPPLPPGNPRSWRRGGSGSSSSDDFEGAMCDAAAARARVMALVKRVPKAEDEPGEQDAQGAEDDGDQASLDPTTAQERRRMKRRASNRESARRVRERRCQALEALEARHGALESRQQRLLGTLCAMQAHKAAMAGQLQELRGQCTQAMLFNARLMSEVAALRGALTAQRGFLA